MELLHIHLTELTLLLHVVIDMQTLKRQVSKLYFFGGLKVLIWGCITGFCCRLAGIPRPIWMAIANGGLLIAHLLFARALPGSMYAASILIGLCSGIQWTLIGPTISELFGLKQFGLIYGTICSASALGSLLFSSLVGHLYDHECQKETYIGNTVLLTKEATAVLSFSSSSSSFSRLTLTNSFLQKAAAAAETTCLGAHCFKLAFFIMAVVCLVGVFINLTLAARTRNLYQSLHKLHSSTTTFSDDDDDDDCNCEDKCDSDPILPHWNTVISQHPPTFQCFFDQPRKANLVFESCLFPICLHQKVDQSMIKPPDWEILLPSKTTPRFMKWAFILKLLLGHPSHNVSMDTVELHSSYGIWCIWFGSNWRYWQLSTYDNCGAGLWGLTFATCQYSKNMNEMKTQVYWDPFYSSSFRRWCNIVMCISNLNSWLKLHKTCTFNFCRIKVLAKSLFKN